MVLVPSFPLPQTQTDEYLSVPSLILFTFKHTGIYISQIIYLLCIKVSQQQLNHLLFHHFKINHYIILLSRLYVHIHAYIDFFKEPIMVCILFYNLLFSHN